MKYPTSENSSNMSQSRRLTEIFGDLAPTPNEVPDFGEIARAGISKRRHRMLAIGAFVTLSVAMAATILPRILANDSPPRGFGVAEAPDQTEEGQNHYENPAKGIALDYPSHWYLNDQGMSDLFSPEEIVVLSTVQPVKGGTCAPAAAIDRLGPTDALLLLLEHPGDVGTFNKRPGTFSLKNLSDPAMIECFPRPVRASSFRDQGRFFQVFIVWGDEASENAKNETLQILDSLRIRPTS